MPAIKDSAMAADEVVQPLSDAEIVKQANELARKFYKSMGYDIRKGFRFDKSGHPQELGCWRMACIAYAELRNTDPEDALSGYEDI